MMKDEFHDPAISLLELKPKRIGGCDSKRYLYTPVHSSIVHPTVKGWKQSKCPLRDEWLNKMQYKHMMDYYSALQREEICDLLQQG